MALGNVQTGNSGVNYNYSHARSARTQKEDSGDKNFLAEQSEDYRATFLEKMEELKTKIENGETETTFQIGAQSFTLKEWDRFLKRFDSLEEKIQELTQERIEKQKEAQEAEKENSVEPCE